MRQLFSILIVLAALLWLVPDAHSEEAKKLYTCGMHPQVIQDHPGNCPICGMKLTPIRNGAGADTNAANSSAIAVDAATQQNMNIRTTQITRGPLRRAIHTVGNVTHSEAATVDVTTKFKGWVEKLYVDATGQHVHRGDPMFEIYSPDLFSAQTEYLLTLSSVSGDNDVLKQSARRKLSYLDVSEEQITELEKTR